MKRNGQYGMEWMKMNGSKWNENIAAKISKEEIKDVIVLYKNRQSIQADEVHCEMIKQLHSTKDTYFSISIKPSKADHIPKNWPLYIFIMRYRKKKIQEYIKTISHFSAFFFQSMCYLKIWSNVEEQLYQTWYGYRITNKKLEY